MLRVFWPASSPTRIDSGGAGDISHEMDGDDLCRGAARNFKAARLAIGAEERKPTEPVRWTGIPIPLSEYLRGGPFRRPAGYDSRGSPWLVRDATALV
jgi:hypothetical protein